jgi:hypothetical protein
MLYADVLVFIFCTGKDAGGSVVGTVGMLICAACMV